MSIERKDLTTYRPGFTGVARFEVHGPGFFLAVDASTSARAKKVALLVENDGMNIHAALDLVENSNPAEVEG